MFQAQGGGDSRRGASLSSLMYELLAMPQEAVLPLLLPAPLCSSSSKLGAAKLSQLKRRLARKCVGLCVSAFPDLVQRAVTQMLALDGYMGKVFCVWEPSGQGSSSSIFSATVFFCWQCYI